MFRRRPRSRSYFHAGVEASGMAQARLRVTIPDGPWVGDVSREFPEARFQVLTATPDDGAGFALVRITADESDPILDAIDDHETITHSSVMAADDGMVTVQVEALVPLLQTVARRAGVPIEMPVEIRDGVARVDVTGNHERVAEFGDALRDVGAAFEVEYVQQRINPGGSLTERQREVLFEAVDRGYYDVPRETTLTEVADHVGIAKSTCSEVLQRVERTIVREFVDDLPRRPLDFESPEEDGIERIQ
ncbi:helix-turn-helix domain-containing protein [Halorubrum sp. SD683]|jgi:predicted DNA binding protein|uniref:Helix-turn-helix domain-containing protein n=2 Tax=Haloferacaceae TaxID=1644056 RepID=A0A256IWY0_HALEZ|nr:MULTISPECIES: helix-turn-helix domain-containing protein [Halorubrum]MDB9251941.1 helix-turn-helix domain-containing protein [Halorubrum ezzemoulense]MDB9254575.1 helix-turn-helix domain-containing protein [Halorubrum ezzemoulense]MDB9275286.1 helix-turn-helix domain-containing protein [Halorubrum ezzemoulense]OTE99251.1 helix-turn-helix domain-containing protein [Halorubrum sp. SD683]OYR60786.1 helix-turn-helix domain-containing protein [Halorubrum ezzemoulense]